MKETWRSALAVSGEVSRDGALDGARGHVAGRYRCQNMDRAPIEGGAEDAPQGGWIPATCFAATLCHDIVSSVRLRCRPRLDIVSSVASKRET
jgi:hypothetical protein